MEKEQKLENILRSLESVVVAFSGGVDSTYLLKKAIDTLDPEGVLAVTANSETYPPRELAEAQELARQMGARHRVVATRELANDNFAQNCRNRCYYCKEELFTTLLKVAKEEGIPHVIDGSNFDDLQDFRPGTKAAHELGIRSPIKEAEITKEELRRYSKALNLPTWSKPAFACLSSRFPYGEEITEAKLKQVAAVEDFVRGLGFNQLRVRYHGSVARLEVLPEERIKVLDHSQAIQEVALQAGFKYVALDLIGYRQGSLNE